jgi:hypothetical protein
MRTSRSRHILSALAIATVIAAFLPACSSSSNPSPQPSTPAPPSAWQTVLNQIQPDGSVSVTTALSAFVLAVGPVPGVSAPAGPPQIIPSGTLAVTWVLRHWKDLNKDQQSAVLTDMGVPTATNQPAAYVAPAKAPTTDPNLACLTADSAGAAKYRAMIDAIVPTITARLGRPLTVAAGTFVSVNTKDLEPKSNGEPSLMYTWRCTKPKSNVTSGCTIHVNATTASGAFTDSELRSFMTHEVMHCFLYDKFGAAYDTMPPWYVEGAPTWVLTDVGGGDGSNKLSSFWTEYLDTVAKPLSQRSYDALGFFVHLAETGTDPWKVIDPIGAALAKNPTTAAGFAAAGVTPAFLDSWGSGYLQGRYPGKAWTSTGTNLPPYQPAVADKGHVANGATLTITSPAFAPMAAQIDVDATVVLVNPGAGTAGRLSLGGGQDSTLDNGGPFCTAAACQCPAGSAGAGTKFTHISSGQQFVGLSAGAKAGSVTLVGLSLEDFCAKPPTACIVGQWTGVGFDVHLQDITETGGAGVTMHIDPKGNLTVVFDGMKPVNFSGKGASGSFVYNGRVSGRIKLPPGGATSGTWEYASAADIKGLTATVHVTSPVELDLGPIDLLELASEFGAGAVSSEPMIAGGWTCSGNTMTTTPPANSEVSGTWTLTRTGPG